MQPDFEPMDDLDHLEPSLVQEFLTLERERERLAQAAIPQEAKDKIWRNYTAEKLANLGPHREFIKTDNGWTCLDHPINVDLLAIGIADATTVVNPLKLCVRQDNEDSLVVTIERGKISDVSLCSKDVTVPLSYLHLPDDNFAAEYFVTGNPMEKAHQVLAHRHDVDPDLALGYLPLDYEPDDEDDDDGEVL